MGPPPRPPPLAPQPSSDDARDPAAPAEHLFSRGFLHGFLPSLMAEATAALAPICVQGAYGRGGLSVGCYGQGAGGAHMHHEMGGYGARTFGRIALGSTKKRIMSERGGGRRADGVQPPSLVDLPQRGRKDTQRFDRQQSFARRSHVFWGKQGAPAGMVSSMRRQPRAKRGPAQEFVDGTSRASRRPPSSSSSA